MPCKKCKDGKVKWGNTGECKYDTIAECEEANKDYYENLKTTSIKELIIANENEELAIDAISLVSSPAIEQDFVFFGKEKNNLTLAKVDEEKRMLVSPALIPNKQIFRYDPNTDSEYYVYFSPETVRKASELYLKHNNHHKATYEHQDRVSGVLTVESWIKEGDMDKSKLYGYDLPNGTWFVKMKINNDELWSRIKDGELKGLSIEGYFTDKMEKMAEKEPTDEEILSALNEIINENQIN
ncbi:MAG: putative peptidase [Prokaryotic dsDNA virus sp.]|nr:MAG: putative peptidase [Prokaryotic dsDNA virus sp.]|tara:strand:- start:2162 stop:2881 length:720 start_codon:yes stop_codon:yes gene_type:complete